jgi:hypothetical protein
VAPPAAATFVMTAVLYRGCWPPPPARDWLEMAAAAAAVVMVPVWWRGREKAELTRDFWERSTIPL